MISNIQDVWMHGCMNVYADKKNKEEKTVMK